MSKSKSTEKSPQPEKGSKAASSIVPSERAVRETVESIAIAFVLAFLFRTFEAEAFVIPTGSMAPTLQGMHKDVACPECGYDYRAGASQDNPEESRQHVNRGPVTSCACPMCGYRRSDVRQESSYNGDRILVSKFAYDINDPRRWDVFVFRYPGDAKINYIKRLVGLPNETLKIRRGDVYVRKADEQKERIARKPPHKVQAMLQEVYDNQYVCKRLDDAGWPRRWFISQPADGAWTESIETESTSVRVWEDRVKKVQPVDRMRQKFEAGGGKELSWLTYQHFLPEPADWQTIENGKPPLPLRRDNIKAVGTLDYPSAIYDDYAYNESSPDTRRGRPNPVADLAVDCEVELREAAGELILQLVEGKFVLECRLDLSRDTGTLTRAHLDNEAAKLPFDTGDRPGDGTLRVSKNLGLREKRSVKVRFANVDDQLFVWIDDRVIEFDGPTTFADTNSAEVSSEDHLRPVRVGVRGAKLRIERLRVLRDVFYIATSTETARLVGDMVDQPDGVTFKLGPDQFLAMGDNSPASQDSRIWNQQIPETPHTVDRRMLIGKALFIYWPHSLDYFPFCPNFPRMGFVR